MSKDSARLGKEGKTHYSKVRGNFSFWNSFSHEFKYTFFGRECTWVGLKHRVQAVVFRPAYATDLGVSSNFFIKLTLRHEAEEVSMATLDARGLVGPETKGKSI